MALRCVGEGQRVIVEPRASRRETAGTVHQLSN
jgi:hypothetical protein